MQIVPVSDGAWTLRIDKAGAGYLTTGAALPPACAFADYPSKALGFETTAVGAAPKPKLITATLPANFFK